MDMGIFRNINNISRISRYHASVNLNFQYPVNDQVILIIRQRPFKAGVVQFHNAASHSGCFFQGHHIFQRHAFLLKRLTFYSVCLNFQDSAGVFFLYKIFFGSFGFGRFRQYPLYYFTNQFFTYVHFCHLSFRNALFVLSSYLSVCVLCTLDSSFGERRLARISAVIPATSFPTITGKIISELTPAVNPR